jgi:hypothetical protein
VCNPSVIPTFQGTPIISAHLSISARITFQSPIHRMRALHLTNTPKCSTAPYPNTRYGTIMVSVALPAQITLTEAITVCLILFYNTCGCTSSFPSGTDGGRYQPPTFEPTRNPASHPTIVCEQTDNQTRDNVRLRSATGSLRLPAGPCPSSQAYQAMKPLF